jgi:hypothetical protein
MRPGHGGEHFRSAPAVSLIRETTLEAVMTPNARPSPQPHRRSAPRPQSAPSPVTKEAQVAVGARVSLDGILLEARPRSLRVKVRRAPDIFIPWEKAEALAREIEFLAGAALRTSS